MAPLQRAYLFDPRLVSPAGVDPIATPLFSGSQYMDAFWVLVQVRDMGTATYIRIGNRGARISTFFGAGDFQIFDVPDGYTFNAAELTLTSDAVDPVIEVSGMFPALSPAAAKGA